METNISIPKKNNNLIKYIKYGALFSENCPILLEYEVIFKFIDYNNKNNLISKLVLSDIEYSISKSTLKLIIEDIAPYSDCFYIILNLQMKREKK